MTGELTPQEAAREAKRAGLPLRPDRHEAVAATAAHIHRVVTTLRELDLAETPPAAAYRAAQEQYRAGQQHAEQEHTDATV